MPSFFDLQRYAATGIASSDMTAFDKMRALAAFGGSSVQTLTGIPPLTFNADGKPLVSWSMKGNGSQTGTPTPSAPIQPEFVGVRTGNLYDVDGKNTANGYVDNRQLNSDGSITTWGSAEISEYIPIVGDASYSFNGVGSYNSPAYCFYDADKQYISGDNYRGRQRITFVAPSNAKYFRFTHIKAATNAMCNAGETVLPYEPYGWAEKITCAGQTTPVYLGQTQTVRRVRKLVLTGEENITSTHTDIGLFNIPVTDYLKTAGTITNICSHYRAEINVDGWSDVTDLTCRFYGNAGSPSKLLYIRDSSFSTVDDFKAYLAAQYAAGTPVTVWYVIETPTTGIVNEPLCKIGTYADELYSTDAGVTIPTVKGQNTLTVDTTLQPSEMTITYRG